MIRLRRRIGPSGSPMPEPAIAEPGAPAALPSPSAIIRRFFDVIGRFERRTPAAETKAAPEIKARITRLAD